MRLIKEGKTMSRIRGGEVGCPFDLSVLMCTAKECNEACTTYIMYGVFSKKNIAKMCGEEKPYSLTCGSCAFLSEGCPTGRRDKRTCLDFRGRSIHFCSKWGGGCMTECMEGCDNCPTNDLRYRDVTRNR